MIKENVSALLQQLPFGVTLVVASKGRSSGEIKEANVAGALIFGENYVKEAESKIAAVGNLVQWHCIGHVQKNKAKRAVKIFDMIETLDSFELAAVLDRECKAINKTMPVLLEVNSASEKQKAGVMPEDVEGELEKIMTLGNLKPCGLMTMGPANTTPEEIRPYFKTTKELFDKIKAAYSGTLEWRYLSMGMSDTYKIAIEEGANLVRVGTAIFGKRP